MMTQLIMDRLVPPLVHVPSAFRQFGGVPVWTKDRELDMVVVMSADATEVEIAAIVHRLEAVGATAFVSRGLNRVVIGMVGDPAMIAGIGLADLPGVAELCAATGGLRLVSREVSPVRSVVDVSGVRIGGDEVTLIAGPCAVETAEQTLRAAQMAKAAGATLLRGGAFKPRTSPYAFQGVGRSGLDILADVRSETGLPVVTEVLSESDVDIVAERADMIQIGTRNMQNFALLRAVGASGRPVLLKRGLMATIEEWLLAAEYIAKAGNSSIVLCERGIRTFEPATRNTLDLSAIPVVQRLSHLPVIVDPSHSGGRRDLVLPLTRAAIAVGADGVIVDVHPEPELALCDGGQALGWPEMSELSSAVADLSTVMGRGRSATPRRLLAS